MRQTGATTWTQSGTIGAGYTPVKALCWDGSTLWAGCASGVYGATLDVPPSLTTDAAATITSTGATLNGNLTATGGPDAASHGSVQGGRVRHVAELDGGGDVHDGRL